jgi:hypothetical protein
VAAVNDIESTTTTTTTDVTTSHSKNKLIFILHHTITSYTFHYSHGPQLSRVRHYQVARRVVVDPIV